MRYDIRATPEGLAQLRDVVATVEDKSEIERHARAVRKYQEERKFAEEAEGEPWWVDVGEGEPC